MPPSDNQFSAGEQAEPKDGVSPETDDRHFVRELRAIGLKSERIRRAILDYYRAFQQRNSWLHEIQRPVLGRKFVFTPREKSIFNESRVFFNPLFSENRVFLDPTPRFGAKVCIYP